MLKRTFLFGIPAGLILIGIFFATFGSFSDPERMTQGEVIGYIGMFLINLAVIPAILTYRDKEMGGKITFSQGFKMGLSVSAVASLIFGVFTILLYEVIAPDMMEKMMAHYAEAIKNNPNLSAEQITQQLQEMEQFAGYGSAFQGVVMFLTVLSIGVVISLIAATVLKKK